jgi:dolichol kinase
MIDATPRTGGDAGVQASAASPLESKATIDYGAEIVRKSIHLFSLSIPVVYYFISRELALWILVPITLAFLIVDLSRYWSPAVARWFYRWFGWLLRRHEQDIRTRRLSGATNVLLAAVFCVAVYPKIITVNAFAILIISDTTSALIGRRYGRHRFLAKSFEGTLSFFVSAVAVILVAPKIQGLMAEYFIGVIAAGIGAIVEASSIPVDDNISIPVGVGAVMWLLYLLFLPSVNVFSLG